jgi:hypothetical protein
VANSGGRASWSYGAHDGGLFSKLRGSSSGDASTTRTKRCSSVLWSDIDLAFTWGKLLRCRDEDDERRLVHAWLSVAVPRQQVQQRQPAERLQLGVAKLGVPSTSSGRVSSRQNSSRTTEFRRQHTGLRGSAPVMKIRHQGVKTGARSSRARRASDVSFIERGRKRKGQQQPLMALMTCNYWWSITGGVRHGRCEL